MTKHMAGWFRSWGNVAQAGYIAVGVGGQGNVVDWRVLQFYSRGYVPLNGGPALHFVKPCPVFGKLGVSPAGQKMMVEDGGEEE